MTDGQAEVRIKIDVEQADRRRGIAIAADTLAMSLDLVGVELAVGAVELEADSGEAVAKGTAEDECVLELDPAVDVARAGIDRVRKGIAEIASQQKPVLPCAEAGAAPYRQAAATSNDKPANAAGIGCVFDVVDRSEDEA